MPEKQLVDRLLSYAESYDIPLSSEQSQLICSHLLLVAKKNEELNLTRISDLDEALVLHALDSLLLSPAVVCGDAGLLDIGTGAGFPGIPLCIAKNCRGVLLDSAGKKITAVEGFIQELGLSEHVRAIAMRVEDYARENPQSVDCVVARAVSETRVLVEYASPLLPIGGILVAAKARPSDEELLQADEAAELCGMECVSRETFQLPESYGTRTVLTFAKTAEAKVDLPRRNGMAVKRPLQKK